MGRFESGFFGGFLRLFHLFWDWESYSGTSPICSTTSPINSSTSPVSSATSPIG
jgi:hypothetical protein